MELLLIPSILTLVFSNSSYISKEKLLRSNWTHNLQVASILEAQNELPIKISSSILQSFELDSKALGSRDFKVDKNLIVVVCPKNSSRFYEWMELVCKLQNANDIKMKPKELPKYFILQPKPVDLPSEFNISNIHPACQNMTIRNEVFIVEQNLQNITIVWEIYNIRGVQFIQKLPIDKGNKLEFSYLANKVFRRKNLKGAEIRAITANDSDWEHEAKFGIDKATGELYFESGYGVNIINFLSDFLNCRVKAIVGDWPDEIQNFNNSGTVFLGLPENITRNEADISIAQYALRPTHLENNLIFLHPTSSSWYSTVFIHLPYALFSPPQRLNIYFIQPPLSGYRNLYFSPFTKDLWISILVVWILILVTIWSFGIIYKYASNCESSNEEYNEEISNDFVLWGFAILGQQGFHTQPSRIPSRIVFLIGYFTCLVLFIAYSASIVSMLSVKTDPIKNANDILWGSFKLQADFVNTPKALILKIIENTSATYTNDFAESEKTIVNNILGSRDSRVQYAQISLPDTFYTACTRNVFLNDTQICETFDWVKLSPVHIGMFVRSNWELRKYFNYAMLYMIEYGLAYRFKQHYMNEGFAKCLDHEHDKLIQAMNLLDVYSAFAILLSGYVLSIVGLFGETMLHKSIDRNIRARLMKHFIF